MNQYYLLAQLPSFSVEDVHGNLPITEEYFFDLCTRFLDKKSMKILSELSLEPPKTYKSTGSVFVDEWYKKERSLRFALAQIRALKLNKKYELDENSFSPDIVQVARTATGMESPLSAELFLNKYRLDLIESIRPNDSFSVDSVFEYALKLKLAQRMKKFDVETGMASYKKIYEKILGDNK